MHEVNLCSPIWDQAPMQAFNTRITRLLMITILFLLYLMYLVITLILAKTIQNLKDEDSGGRLI